MAALPAHEMRVKVEEMQKLRAKCRLEQEAVFAAQQEHAIKCEIKRLTDRIFDQLNTEILHFPVTISTRSSD